MLLSNLLPEPITLESVRSLIETGTNRYMEQEKKDSKPTMFLYFAESHALKSWVSLGGGGDTGPISDG